MFIDEAVIHVCSGRGGNGVVHFRREKYVPLGGPDGGNGGKGGDVVLGVSSKLNTLYTFRHQTHFKAADGSNGGKQNQTGKSGENLVLHVPPGTIVYDDERGEIMGDLVDVDQQLVVAEGGRGGRGNASFANSRNRAPRIAEKGEPAQECRLRLELRLIADIGIIGVPNAGKSTFLSAVTNAKPKIAPYPFTTLEPNLGVAELDEDTTLILADIPGLIEGAHQGVGLGHDFLKHIQRTRVLIHLLDGTAENPLLDFAQINSELALFDPELGDKPQVVALNKNDLTEVAERYPIIEDEIRERGYELFSISAIAGTNVRELLYRASSKLREMPVIDKEEIVPVYRVEGDQSEFRVERIATGWRVSGGAIERAAAMTYWEYDQSVRRFQRILSALGVEEALRKEGVKEGDTVFIGEYELEWQD
ncbi:MAG: GTPase ObgE [Anaerolineales bacterium]|jgi:GTP-binding protein